MCKNEQNMVDKQLSKGNIIKSAPCQHSYETLDFACTKQINVNTSLMQQKGRTELDWRLQECTDGDILGTKINKTAILTYIIQLYYILL